MKEGKRPGPEWTPLLRGSLIHRYVTRWDNNYWVKYGPWLAAPRDEKIFSTKETLYIRQTGDSIIATLVDRKFIGRNNLHLIPSTIGGISLKLLLGLINSTLLDIIYTYINPEKGEELAEIKKDHIEQLPIPVCSETISNTIAGIVTKILVAKAASATADTTALEAEIDVLVYHLYGLKYEEVLLVEPGFGMSETAYVAAGKAS